MDLRTFRRNGPGLAECESEAAWRRLWGDRRAHRSLDTRGPVSNVAASWPQFGYRGQTHSTLCAARAGKVSDYGAWLQGAYGLGRGDAIKAVGLESLSGLVSKQTTYEGLKRESQLGATNQRRESRGCVAFGGALPRPSRGSQQESQSKQKLTTRLGTDAGRHFGLALASRPLPAPGVRHTRVGRLS